jgi:hypothetical protein
VCYVVTAAVGGINARELNTTLARAGLDMTFEVLDNPKLQAQLRAGERYLAQVGGTCDCGTWLGADPRGERLTNAVHRAAEERRRKGWSQSKIERWMKEKHAADQPAQHRRDEPEARAPWLDVVDTAIAAGGARSFGLILHWYGGSIDTEEFPLSRLDLSADELTTGTLRAMREDVLYSFGPN